VPALARQGAASAVLCAFDLLGLEGRDLRREPIEERKQRLAKLLKGSHLRIVLNEYFEEEGSAVYRAACQFGCEDVVSMGGLARPIGQAAQRIG
jgi:bifunctional non-homologous end joining protein LigD